MGKTYQIIKTLNNNCMILDVGGVEKLLLGKGIAFGKKNGEYCELPSEIDKVFTIEEKKNVLDFQQLLSRNEESFISFCEELIWDVTQQTHKVLNERIHISLIDHLSCTVRRLRIGEQIINPFLQEIEVLYEKEFALAQFICSKMELKYNLKIPRGEVGFVALHLHSAMYNGKLTEALKSNRICNQVVTLLEDEFHTSIDRTSFDCSRFMVHLVYLIKRIRVNDSIENDLADIIIEKYPQSYEYSKKAASIVEKELKIDKISKAELAYLTMHIERLSNTIMHSKDSNSLD
jgi:transcriptional antiterminator